MALGGAWLGALWFAVAVDDPPHLAGGAGRNFRDADHLNIGGAAEDQLEAFLELMQVLGQTFLTHREVTKHEGSPVGLLQLPLADELPVEADADEMSHEDGGLQRAVLGDQQIVLASLQTLKPGKIGTARTLSRRRPRPPASATVIESCSRA